MRLRNSGTVILLRKPELSRGVALPRAKKPKVDYATEFVVRQISRVIGWRQWKGLPVPDWAELAAVAGLTPSRMSEIRSHERRIQLGEAIAIASQLEVRVGWLLAGEEPMLRNEESTPKLREPDSPTAGSEGFYQRRASELLQELDIPPAKPADDQQGGRDTRGG